MGTEYLDWIIIIFLKWSIVNNLSLNSNQTTKSMPTSHAWWEDGEQCQSRSVDRLKGE